MRHSRGRAWRLWGGFPWLGVVAVAKDIAEVRGDGGGQLSQGPIRRDVRVRQGCQRGAGTGSMNDVVELRYAHHVRCGEAGTWWQAGEDDNQACRALSLWSAAALDVQAFPALGTLSNELVARIADSIQLVVVSTRHEKQRPGSMVAVPRSANEFGDTAHLPARAALAFDARHDGSAAVQLRLPCARVGTFTTRHVSCNPPGPTQARTPYVGRWEALQNGVCYTKRHQASPTRSTN